MTKASAMKQSTAKRLDIPSYVDDDDAQVLVGVLSGMGRRFFHHRRSEIIVPSWSHHNWREIIDNCDSNGRITKLILSMQRNDPQFATYTYALPSKIRGLQMLQFLKLVNVQRIPTEISNLSNLETLWFDRCNHFS